MIKALKIIVVLMLASALILAVKAAEFLQESKDEKTSHVASFAEGFWQPEVLEVKLGEIVTWENHPAQIHSVTFAFLSKTLLPDETWSLEINEDWFLPGEYPYFDEFSENPDRSGKIIVKE